MMTGQRIHSVRGLGKGILLLSVCFWVGVVADLLAAVPLLFPEVARLMFGLPVAPADEAYLYVSRIAASLMLGWTLLLAWGGQKPLERKEVVLHTAIPVLVGLLRVRNRWFSSPIQTAAGCPELPAPFNLGTGTCPASCTGTPAARRFRSRCRPGQMTAVAI